MIMPVIGYKQMNDKENEYYYPIDIDAFLNGDIIVDKKHKIVNIYSYVDSKLVDAEPILIDGSDDDLLSESDFNVSDNKIGKYNGFLKMAIICLTDSGCFKNLYLLRKNKLGMLVHERVQAKFMIKKTKNGYDVIL